MKEKKWIIISAVLAGLIAVMADVVTTINSVMTADKEKEPFGIWVQYPDNMAYADEKTFQILKEACHRIEFHGGFKKGNIETYDYYKDKYAKLLSGEAEIMDNEVTNNIYGEGYNLEHYRYDMTALTSASTNIYFFDMDEDNLPELCIAGISGTYIIKYIPETDRYIIWWGDMSSGGSIAGSRKIHYGSDESFYTYYELNEKGEVDFSAAFLIEVFGEYKYGDWEYFYMVSLPDVGNKTIRTVISKEMKKQSYITDKEEYYFRVTKKQFKQLTEEYFEAYELSLRNRVDLSYFLPEQERVYSTQYHFPDDMVYADDKTFEILKNIYENIDFYGEFKKGNQEIYEYYKDKYAKLLSGEAQCEDIYDGRVSLEYYGYDLEELSKTSTKLLYFDMDEDNLPELCISGEEGTYIIKYISNINQYHIWWEDWAVSAAITGSRKIRNSTAGSAFEFYDFYEMKEDGSQEFDLVFGVKKSNDGIEKLYMVSLPLYSDNARSTVIPDSMRKQSYISADEKRCFFRVTKKQYEELTKEYFDTDGILQKEYVPLSYFLSDL